MKIWIYKDDAQQGPFLPEELPGLGITPETKVWFAGLPKWYPAGTVPELAFLFEEPEETEPEETEEEAETVLFDRSNSTERTEPPSPPSPPSPPCPACPEPPPVPPLPPEPPVAPMQSEQWQPCPAQQCSEIPQCPPVYLIWSLVLLVLCCTPFAVASLITGILTMSRYNAGRYEAARKLSEATAWLIMLGFAFGTIPNFLMLLLFL